MKIYTRTGDQGETGLFGGPRVPKDAARIEAYGTVDELNAAIGVARAQLPQTDRDVDAVLEQIQNDLFDLGAELATPDPAKELRSITTQHIEDIEQTIDRFEEKLAPLKQFILPGGSADAARLHLARTICRRAERRVVRLSGESGEHVSAESIAYLNRLSDLLFVLARAANRRAGIEDAAWHKRTV